jgi:hypothetical protein
MADKVFVVVASSADSPAQAFVRRYAGQGLRLLTPGDLSYAGWCYRLGAMPTAVAIIGEQPVAVRNIVGVLTHLSSVSTYDVDHIAAADQTYVAAEMQAFLFSWLTSLNCPVVNQPTPHCLAGPAWSPAQWVHAAARLGLQVIPTCQYAIFAGTSAARGKPRPPGVTVTIVGQRAIGKVAPALARQAHALAAAAGVDLLAVRFNGREDGAAFVGAHLWPNLAAATVATTVWDYLLARAESKGSR